MKQIIALQLIVLLDIDINLISVNASNAGAFVLNSLSWEYTIITYGISLMDIYFVLKFIRVLIMYRTSKSNVVTSAFQVKLEKFDITHHETVRASFVRQMEKFKSQTDSFRCQYCWLRHYDCHCQYLNQQRDLYRPQFQLIQDKVRVLMYYHYIEIGRSPNTGHLFEILAKDFCQRILFADHEKEKELFEAMKEDHNIGANSYCVLYPTTSSVTLQEWLNSRTSKYPSTPVKLIALDGTYAHAMRQFKHLKKSAALYNFPLNVVKLDLGTGGLKSAIQGIMVQPQKDKICTYQAVLLALREFNISPELYSGLKDELDGWLKYIVERGIKRIKSKIKTPYGLRNTNDEEEEFDDEYNNENHLSKPLETEISLVESTLPSNEKPLSNPSLSELLHLKKTAKFYVYERTY